MGPSKAKSFYRKKVHQWWENFNIPSGYFKQTTEINPHYICYENEAKHITVWVKQDDPYDSNLEERVDRVELHVLLWSNNADIDKIIREVCEKFKVW